jgi:uncharacterized protein YegJ (DUF2314 family)
MRPKTLLVFFIASFTVLASVPVVAQTILERAERDETTPVPRDDPDMVAAMRKARATLTDFLTLARAPRPGTSGFAVKVAIREKGKNEYFWITPFEEREGRFTGRINNTPRGVKSVTFGQTFAFTENEIVDWLYMDGGKMKGKHSLRNPQARAEPGRGREAAVWTRMRILTVEHYFFAAVRSPRSSATSAARTC